MSEEEKELAKQCVKLLSSASSTAALLGSRSVTRLTYQADQISHSSRVLGDLGKPIQSTTDRLVSTFSKRKDVCWLTVAFNPEEGLLLQATAKDRQKLLKLNRDDVDSAAKTATGIDYPPKHRGLVLLHFNMPTPASMIKATN
ncbi:hypothetical protein IV203_031021 [Nitzschia inconspicua]|uniref:Uncharacterized protein n=1 Tax=Nitzschia inconspicua TaxID=303405 RepID=A0A9K3Q291_9STRA|nr:hypothetical protein IV203_031021 [Nitzschia inconspicua]